MCQCNVTLSRQAVGEGQHERLLLKYSTGSENIVATLTFTAVKPQLQCDFTMGCLCLYCIQDLCKGIVVCSPAGDH